MPPKSYAQARVDASFGCQELSAHPVMAAWRDWRLAAVGGVAPDPASVAAVGPVAVCGDSEQRSVGGCADDCQLPGRAGEDWTLRRQPVPATRRLGHHCWTRHCTQVLSSCFPDGKRRLHLKDRRELAAHASRHSLTSRGHICLSVRHCIVGAVGTLCETSV